MTDKLQRDQTCAAHLVDELQLGPVSLGKLERLTHNRWAL